MAPTLTHSPKPDAPALAVIGAGNMGRAIILGGLDAGVLSPDRVFVAEPDASKHDALTSHGLHAAHVSTNPARALELLAAADPRGQLLLAVKPQMLAHVASALRPALTAAPRTVISILAGTPTAKVREALGGRTPVVRAMPNLPASVGAGATALCVGAGALEDDAAFAEQLFRAVGPLVVRCEEGMMDAFTAVAGSGPAYLYYLAEAMIAGATEVGFPDDDARRIVKQTLVGAAKLLEASPEDPAALRAAVTSKGGTTAAATAFLEAHAVMKAWAQAIVAARDRGRELGKL